MKYSFVYAFLKGKFLKGAQQASYIHVLIYSIVEATIDYINLYCLLIIETSQASKNVNKARCNDVYIYFVKIMSFYIPLK